MSGGARRARRLPPKDVRTACGFDYGTLPRTALAPSLVVCAAQHAAELTADADALRHRSAPDV